MSEKHLQVGDEVRHKSSGTPATIAAIFQCWLIGDTKYKVHLRSGMIDEWFASSCEPVKPVGLPSCPTFRTCTSEIKPGMVIRVLPNDRYEVVW